MIQTYIRGSERRRWDLHLHTKDTDIVEGGEDAFLKREKKYNFKK